MEEKTIRKSIWQNEHRLHHLVRRSLFNAIHRFDASAPTSQISPRSLHPETFIGLARASISDRPSWLLFAKGTVTREGPSNKEEKIVMLQFKGSVLVAPVGQYAPGWRMLPDESSIRRNGTAQVAFDVICINSSTVNIELSYGIVPIILSFTSRRSKPETRGAGHWLSAFGASSPD